MKLGLLTCVILVGCCLAVTTARRARCRISVDYEVSAIYNQDDNSWMIRMYWGDRPKCQVLLSYGKTNSDQSFKKSITNTCIKNKWCDFMNISMSCKEFQNNEDMKLTTNCRACGGVRSTQTFTMRDLIYNRQKKCDTVYTEGATKTKYSDSTYIDQLEYSDCSEEKSCNGPALLHGPGCYCKDNLVRVNGTCVPQQSCPETSPIFDPLNLQYHSNCEEANALTFSWMAKEHYDYQCFIESLSGVLVREPWACINTDTSNELKIHKESLPVGIYTLNLTEVNTGKTEKITFAVDKVYKEYFWLSARATINGAVVCFASNEIKQYECTIGSDEFEECTSCKTVALSQDSSRIDFTVREKRKSGQLQVAYQSVVIQA